MRRGISFTIVMTAVIQSCHAEELAVEKLAGDAAMWRLPSGDSRIPTRCELLACKEIRSMRFPYLSHLVIGVLPILCFLSLWGVGWIGYSAPTEIGEPGSVRVTLSSHDDTGAETGDPIVLSRDEATIADESGNSELVSEQFPIIRGGDILGISVPGCPIDQPIHGLFRVESSGKVALGASYGRVSLEGLDVEEAEAAITEHIASLVHQAKVSVTFDYLPGDAKRTESVPTGPLRRGELLRLRIGSKGGMPPLFDEVVRIDGAGQVPVPIIYDRINAESRSIMEIEQQIKDQLVSLQWIKDASVLVTREVADSRSEERDRFDARLDRIERLLRKSR